MTTPWEDLPAHTVRVQDTNGPAKILECPDCSYVATWDGQRLNLLVPGDPNFGHGGSW